MLTLKTLGIIGEVLGLIFIILGCVKATIDNKSSVQEQGHSRTVGLILALCGLALIIICVYFSEM